MYKWNGRALEKVSAERPKKSLFKTNTARKPMTEETLAKQAKKREK
jgi:hypothetical protein